MVIQIDKNVITSATLKSLLKTYAIGKTYDKIAITINAAFNKFLNNNFKNSFISTLLFIQIS